MTTIALSTTIRVLLPTSLSKLRPMQLMKEPAATLTDQLPMTDVMRTFDQTHADWLPVLDADNHLKGYISRQRLYSQYREMVADMSED